MATSPSHVGGHRHADQRRPSGAGTHVIPWRIAFLPMDLAEKWINAVRHVAAAAVKTGAVQIADAVGADVLNTEAATFSHAVVEMLTENLDVRLALQQ